MSRRLRIVLVAQLAFFALWGGQLVLSHRESTTVWLETAPVDPRDLLAGHYVDLRYGFAIDAQTLCADVRPPGEPGPVWVRLESTGRRVTTTDGAVPISRAVDCRADRPTAHGTEWLAGERTAGPGLSSLRFGLERFYVAEASPLRQARSGSVVARVTINDASEGRLAELVSLIPSTSPVDRPVSPGDPGTP